MSFFKKINSHFQLKSKTRNGLRSCLFFTMRLLNGSWWSAFFSEGLEKKLVKKCTDNNSYYYIVSNTLLHWRAETLLTKEPETIEWLKKLTVKDILFDIGANVGMYSIYAGVRGTKVLSFEPESGNYSILNRNIALNNLSSKVTAYNLALSDKIGFDVLKIPGLTHGAAHTTFGKNETLSQSKAEAILEQGCYGTTLDHLVYQDHFPCPSFIKIDVDGIESKIVNGARQLLKDQRLKSILIEINESFKDDLEVVALIQSCGFELKMKGKGDYNKDTNSISKEYIFFRV